MREDGATYSQIARQLGLSRQRVAAVLGPMGIRRGRSKLPAMLDHAPPLGAWAALEIGGM